MSLGHAAARGGVVFLLFSPPTPEISADDHALHMQWGKGKETSEGTRMSNLQMSGWQIHLARLLAISGQAH